MQPPPEDLVTAIVDALGGRTIGTAESATAGAIAQAIATGAGASEWFRGGIISYHREVKYELLGVPRGPVVNHTTARSMAEGAARLLRADVVVSVTGAAGPGGLDGAPAGTVFIGYQCNGEVDSVEHHFDGEPTEVLDQTKRAALAGLAQRLRASSRSTSSSST